MKCHFVFDEQTQLKILIPGCYGSLHRNDKACCTCNDFPYSDLSFSQFEKLKYNEEVKRLNDIIKAERQHNTYLIKHISTLIRVIEKLLKRKL